MSDKKRHVLEFLNQGIRFDGRKADEFRKIEIETGFISTAEGSAKVKFGDTEVIAGIKMSVGTPYPDSMDEGVLMVGAELLPIASTEFESGPPSIESIELARVIDRAIRESHMMDTKKLCIKSGEQVWMVQVDLVPLNADGNLIDACALASIAALKDAKFPKLVNGVVDYKDPTKNKIPLNDEPLSITIFKIGDHLVVDPTRSEELLADARLTFGIKSNGNICSMQKGSLTPLTVDEVNKMALLATKKVTELRKSLSKVK